jgi:Gas vesicle synthesis protein GvpL/GvpF
VLAPPSQVADASVARDSAHEAWTRRAYLVERGRVDEFRRRLDDLSSSSPALRVTCTGPWPPYSFVSEEAA